MTAVGPGLYLDIPAAVYHADPCDEPSLSSSIANLLLAKTPAHARLAHPRLNPAFKESPTSAMNLGAVAHEILLGKGGGFMVSPFDDYRTKDARAWRDATIASGRTPIKDDDYTAACQMAQAIRRRLAETQEAGRAFLVGDAETVIVWKEMFVTCRAMIDWLDLDDLAIYDLKTTGTGLSDRALQAKIAGGLDLQAAFHLRGLEHVHPEVAGRMVWRWGFIEDEEPFESRVIEMDAMTRAFGDRKAALAIATWRQCLTLDRWPGYPRSVERLPYPAWAEAAWLAREMAEAEEIAA